MIGDYEDDTHFCLKCHTTIIGLDNYVNHRKTGCTKTVVDLPKSPLPSQLLPPDESFNSNADDFFSSLELQSSSKKPPPSTSGKQSAGILTRSKIATIHASTKEQPQEIPQSKSGKNIWIGGHQLKLGHGDNQSKLFKAVDQLERRKEEPLKIDDDASWSDVESEDFDYDVDESSDEDNHDAPPKYHTGGKWKPSSPIQWNNRDWNNAPSPTYTGGKWKPSAKRPTSPPPSHTKGKWKPSFSSLSPRENYDYPPPSFTGGKWNQTKIPPSTHTKGKWKPDETWSQTKAPPSTHTKGKWKPDDDEPKPKPKKPKEDSTNPDPSYTKGKWIPIENKKPSAKITDDSPFRKSSGTVQYWCRPCNRRLASKIVYERHLKSELHFKRTLHDKEFDDASGVLEKRNKAKMTITIKPKIDERSNKKRKRKKTVFKCEVCRSKVTNDLIGKHLISHYHCRKGDITTPIAQNLVLENIQDIVLQSPFQCGVCQFYFNHHSDFLNHWLSSYHLNKERTRKGYFWCSFCQFKDDNSGVMYSHLISADHKEVISVINRSVPIIIKKISPVNCQDCNEEFLLNFALIQHCRREKHNINSDLEKCMNNYNCATCNSVFRSASALLRHKQNNHGMYPCDICNINFKSSQEVKLHRNTTLHKYNCLKLDPSKNEGRTCEYCGEELDGFLEFKKHLLEIHPNFCPKCMKCGEKFAVPQDLTVHLRTKACRFKNNPEMSKSCTQCPFSSDSAAELLFHQVLHTEPIQFYSNNEKMENSQTVYKCPMCEKFFAKSSLQGHLRIHTNERPYVCGICKKSFTRKNIWVYHVRNHSKDKDEKKQEKIQEKKETEGDRPFLCSTCGASFARKCILQQHMTIHTGRLYKCPEDGCVYAARSMGELQRHSIVHSNAKTFSCNICDYRGKNKQQLKRHLTSHDTIKKFKCNKCKFTARTMTHLSRHARLHTGAKPYSCPHCLYKCNTMENLRKHILNTGKHRGKSIYECKFCVGNSRFQSNFAKDFKAHLIEEHPQVFNASKATTFIAGIYDARKDNVSEVEDIDKEEDEEEVKEGTEGEKEKPTVIVVHKKVPEETIRDNADPVVGSSTSSNLDEIFPMYIVSVDSEGWNMVGNYDVEESGALVPFNNDSDRLFQEI